MLGILSRVKELHEAADRTTKLIGYLKPTNWLRFIVRTKKVLDLMSDQFVGDRDKSIYIYHIRKVGGTSLNFMFLRHAKGDDKKIYQKLNLKPSPYILGNLNRKLIHQKTKLVWLRNH